MVKIIYLFIPFILIQLLWSQPQESTQEIILEMNKLELNGYAEEAYNLAVDYLNANPDFKCDRSSMGLIINGIRIATSLSRPFDIFYDYFKTRCSNDENDVVFYTYFKGAMKRSFSIQNKSINESVILLKTYLEILKNFKPQNIDNQQKQEIDLLIEGDYENADRIIKNASDDKYEIYAQFIVEKYIEQKRLNDAYRFVINNKKSPVINKFTRILAIYALEENDYKNAESLFLHVLEEISDYEKLYLIVAKMHLYSTEYVTDYINTIFANSTNSRNDFWQQLKKMYLKRLSPVHVTDYVYTIDNNEQRLKYLCIANYFIGIYFLINNNEENAKIYFIDATSTGLTDLTEYKLAQYEAKRGTNLDNNVSGNKNTIAVLDFDFNGFTNSESKVAADFITSMLTERNIFRVLERAKMEEILIEQGFQLSGCFSNECLVEAGQLLGVQLLLAGNIGRFGDLNIIQLRIIDVKTSEILKSTRYTISGDKEQIIKYGLGSSLDALLN